MHKLLHHEAPIPHHLGRRRPYPRPHRISWPRGVRHLPGRLRWRGHGVLHGCRLHLGSYTRRFRSRDRTRLQCSFWVVSGCLCCCFARTDALRIQRAGTIGGIHVIWQFGDAIPQGGVFGAMRIPCLMIRRFSLASVEMPVSSSNEYFALR
jgi:hypothetical protein